MPLSQQHLKFTENGNPYIDPFDEDLSRFLVIMDCYKRSLAIKDNDLALMCEVKAEIFVKGAKGWPRC